MLEVSTVIKFTRGDILLLDNNTDIESVILQREDYINIYDYSMYNILGRVVAITDNKISIKYPRFIGSDLEKLDKMIMYMNRFEYNELQPDPNLLFKVGGNCHAQSLFLYNMALYNSVDMRIEYTDDHVYNIATVGDSTYTIDITGKLFYKEKEV